MEPKTITAEESRDQAVNCINAIRQDANAMEDKAAAIDFAIQGTLSTLDTAIEVVDAVAHPVAHELAKKLAESWTFGKTE